MLKDFKPKSKKERMITDFLITHIDLIEESNKSLNSFWHIEETEEGMPMTFDHYASFMYSYDKEDRYFRHTNEMFSMNANEYGIVPFRTIMTEGEDVKESELPRKYVSMLDDLGKIVDKYT